MDLCMVLTCRHDNVIVSDFALKKRNNLRLNPRKRLGYAFCSLSVPGSDVVGGLPSFVFLITPTQRASRSSWSGKARAKLLNCAIYICLLSLA